MAGIITEPAVQPTIPTKRTYKAPADVLALATGLRPLDRALGISGLPYGKITELMGPGLAPTSGGTTCITAKIAAKVQRKQEIVTIIDMSHTFDPWQAERCGLIAPQLLLARPDTIFAALTTLESASRNTELVVVVMGFVAGLLKNVEPDLLKTLLRRLHNIVEHSRSVFLFITSPQKNDPFSPSNYPKGFPLADIADIRLWVQDENWTYKSGLATVYTANVTVIKNRLAVAGKGANIRVKMAGA